MNGQEAIRRISRERQEWRDAGEGPEVSWTARGLDRALEILRQIVEEERFRTLERRPRLQRWLAADLYKAVKGALAHLKRGERAAAIETLRTAIELVEAQKKGIETQG